MAAGGGGGSRGGGGTVRPRSTHLLRFACRTLLTLTFLWAGLAKARGPHLFATDIGAFQIPIPPALILAAAFYLPWVEILSAAGLWTRRWRAGALVLSAGLLAMFCVALLSAWVRGLRLDCGCFGPGETGTATNLPLAIARNLALLGACGILWRSGDGEGGVKQM